MSTEARVGGSGASLFAQAAPRRAHRLAPAALADAASDPRTDTLTDAFDAGPDEGFVELFERAADPGDPWELRDLALGRADHRSVGPTLRPDLVERWRAAPRRRVVDVEEILSSRTTVRFVKELFNAYFRDDLYGALRPSASVILSGGTGDETVWGLPEVLKECLTFAMARDWYGYSDSRGREPVREAVAGYENARIEGSPYGAGNVALTMGGTASISSLSDFVLSRRTGTTAPALCAIPNYPPLVEAVARRSAVRLVPVPVVDGVTSLRALLDAVRPDTPMVLLQTAGNPTGARVDLDDLDALIQKTAGTGTTIVLDECHEWLGPVERFVAARAAPHVVRVSSLSKRCSAPGLKVGWLVADERFVEAYYEEASTSFGGPPSVFYSLVEVLARFDRWSIEGLERPGEAELAEFDPSYGLTLPALQTAFRTYESDRIAREHGLSALRHASTARLSRMGAVVLPPRFSINTAFELPEWDDSYVAFRDVLHRTGVSVLPGVLTFCLARGVVRMTSARSWPDLDAGLARLAAVPSATGALAPVGAQP